MEESGLISVIIPVYNVENYLRECVDSVLNQTYQNFEIILVDDGSTDGSPTICDEYATSDERIRVIHQSNGGLSVARNNGLQASSGDYVYFLDSDDWIEPSSLEVLLECAKERRAQVVFFDALSFEDGGKLCDKQNYARKRCYGDDSGIEILSRLQDEKDYHSAVPLLFMQRRFLEKNHLEFEPGIVYEDMLFTFQAYCLANCAAHVNRKLYHRRYRSGSITSVKKSKKYFNSSKIVYERVSAFTTANDFDCEATRRYIIRCAYNAINIYSGMERNEKAECKKDFRALIDSLISKKAFGSKALMARCYGRIPWIIVRSLEKVGII